MSDAPSTDRPNAAAPRRPPLPYGLGLAGLIPFWALALARVTGLPHAIPPAEIQAALATYAATIISFLGGIRWGIAVRADQSDRAAFDYLGSVVPQLLGWSALALPDPARLFVLGLIVLVLGPLDRRLVRRGLAPDWFGRLRTLLSLCAGAALFLAGFA